MNEIRNLEKSEKEPDTPPTPTLEERLSYHEQVLSDLYAGYEQAGKAVNRIEQFLFCTIKILIDKGVVDFKDLSGLCDELLKSEDLLEFWGVERPQPPEEKETEVNPVEEDSKEEDPVA